jgi:hypothetical protein
MRPRSAGGPPVHLQPSPHSSSSYISPIPNFFYHFMLDNARQPWYNTPSRCRPGHRGPGASEPFWSEGGHEQAKLGESGDGKMRSEGRKPDSRPANRSEGAGKCLPGSGKYPVLLRKVSAFTPESLHSFAAAQRPRHPQRLQSRDVTSCPLRITRRAISFFPPLPRVSIRVHSCYAWPLLPAPFDASSLIENEPNEPIQNPAGAIRSRVPARRRVTRHCETNPIALFPCPPNPLYSPPRPTRAIGIASHQEI